MLSIQQVLIKLRSSYFIYKVHARRRSKYLIDRQLLRYFLIGAEGTFMREWMQVVKPNNFALPHIKLIFPHAPCRNYSLYEEVSWPCTPRMGHDREVTRALFRYAIYGSIEQ